MTTGSENQAYFERLRRVECRDASYRPAAYPLVFDRALGSEIWDADGRRYIDLCAGFGVLALGHNHPVFLETLRPKTSSQPPLIEHGMGDVFASTSKVALLEQLRELLPESFRKISLALSGGQAVELALKTALLRKPGVVICFEGSYHGLDLGVLPLTSRQDFKEPFKIWQKPELVCELPFNCDEASLQAAIADIEAAGQEVSAILVEPIQGRAGVRPATRQFLETLRRVADQMGALLVFDEIFVGLGRCGRWSFSEQVPADLICLGKALGGGLPLSAVAGRADIMDVWPENTGEAIHTGTFFGHPLSCRTGLATLRYLNEELTLEKVIALGDAMQVSLRSLQRQFPNLIQELRGQGCMWGLVLNQPGAGARLMDRLLLHGLITLPSAKDGSILSLTPALNMDLAIWEEAVALLQAGLQQMA